MKFENLERNLSAWLDGFMRLLPDLVLALAIVVAFALIARMARKYLVNTLDRVYTNKTVSRLLAVITSVIILIVGALIALSILDLSGIVTSVLAGAGIIGIALGFAFQDIAANFISGIIIAFQNPFNVGDLVKTNEHEGEVRNVTLRTTEIRTFQGQTVYIPNKDVLLNPLVDYSYPDERRIDLELGVSYDDDLEKAEEVALNAVSKLKGLKEDRPVDMYYVEFGDSSINFVIRFWVDFNTQVDFLSVRSQAIKNIKSAFDENNISIPFPVRTLDFDKKDAKSFNQKLE